MKLMRRAIPMMLAAVVLAACGGDDGGTAAAPTDAPGAGGGETAEITIVDFTFSGPSEVPVGTTVTVTNEDSASHTWTAENGAFDSGSLATGDSFEHTFDEAGTFAYVCNFHPSMTGTIEVTG